MRQLTKKLEGGPAGATPLCAHINAIIMQIRDAELRLRQANQVACIVICTDGICSDGDLVRAMKPLEKLPCWVVVKLCTDDDKIVDYWNNIDNHLELDMDVLDDFESEAVECFEHNPWLVYGLELHRLREWGFKALKELDILDERKLSSTQMLHVLELLFNKKTADFNDPQGDPLEFKRDIKRFSPTINHTFNATVGKMTPWINYNEIKRAYQLPGGTKCSIM